MATDEVKVRRLTVIFKNGQMRYDLLATFRRHWGDSITRNMMTNIQQSVSGVQTGNNKQVCFDDWKHLWVWILGKMGLWVRERLCGSLMMSGGVAGNLCGSEKQAGVKSVLRLVIGSATCPSEAQFPVYRSTLLELRPRLSLKLLLPRVWKKHEKTEHRYRKGKGLNVKF